MTENNTHSPVAVILGATSGLGAELANVALARGYRLALADQATETRDDCELAVQLDVRNGDAVERFASTVFERFGRVDLLFNNAGIMRPGSIWEQSAEHLKAVIDVNLGGVLNGVRAFVPKMLEQEHASRIVNTASLAGLIPAPRLAGYCISKHAVVALSETLAIDLDAINAKISVSVVCPGAVKTNIMKSAHEALSDGADAATLSQVQKMEYGLKAMGNDPLTVAETVFTRIDEGQFCIWATGESPEPFLARSKAIAQGETAGFTQWGHER